MKLTLRHLLIFFLIAACSVGFGFAFDGVATAVEKRNHPRPETITPFVEKYAREFGVPETVIWATVCTESNFASNATRDGKVGLMMISPALYETVCREVLGEEPLDSGILYDPQTNLRVGTAYLSYLYRRYGVWDSVYAAYFAGTDAVDAWLTDPAHVSEQGFLKDLPRDVQAHIEEVQKTVALYGKLYYQ